MVPRIERLNAFLVKQNESFFFSYCYVDHRVSLTLRTWGGDIKKIKSICKGRWQVGMALEPLTQHPQTLGGEGHRIRMLESSAFIHLDLQRAELTFYLQSLQFWFPFISQDSLRVMTEAPLTASPPPPLTILVVLCTSPGKTHLQNSRTVVYKLFSCLPTERILKNYAPPYTV